MPHPVVLLGPQRLRPTLVDALDGLGLLGTVAAVTAGWEEREDEIDELRRHLGRRVVNLDLHRRTEEIFVRDRAFFVAYRERRMRLRELKHLYRRRLEHAMTALLELLHRGGDPELLEPERGDALDAVRRLDAHHLERVEGLYAEFEEQWRPGERPEIARQRSEVAALAVDADALALAGGNVAVLVNRLRLLEVDRLLALKPVLAWSAGAMTLGERIVIYHDSPPQGPGYPEVFSAGLGLAPGVLPLPHAHRRLRLGDATRVAVFARRFAPLDCLAMEDGACSTCTSGAWRHGAGVARLTLEGAVREASA